MPDLSHLDQLTRDLIVIGAEVLLVTLTFLLFGLVSGFLLRRLESAPGLRKASAGLAGTRRFLRVFLSALWGVRSHAPRTGCSTRCRSSPARDWLASSLG